MLKQSDSKRRRAQLFQRKVLLACAVAAALIAVSAPALTSAHWIYTRAAFANRSVYIFHPTGDIHGTDFVSRATNFPIGSAAGPGGRMMGETGGFGSYNLAVRVSCEGYGLSPWTQAYKEGPWAIHWSCENGSQAEYTHGAFAE